MRGWKQAPSLVICPTVNTRLLGGRAPGFDAEITLNDWRGLLRLATAGSVGWFQAWEAGEWETPDLVPVFAVFNANAASLGDAGRAKGFWRAGMRFAHWLNRNTHAGSERNINAHYDLGNDFYGNGWAIRWSIRAVFLPREGQPRYCATNQDGSSVRAVAVKPKQSA